MYVGSTSMPTVVELNGTESKVCLILPKKINYLPNNEYFISGNIFENDSSLQITFNFETLCFLNMCLNFLLILK